MEKHSLLMLLTRSKIEVEKALERLGAGAMFDRVGGRNVPGIFNGGLAKSQADPTARSREDIDLSRVILRPDTRIRQRVRIMVPCARPGVEDST